MTASQQAFLKAYYNAEIHTRIDEIMLLGRPLATLGQEDHGLECYLLLLPLLHSTSEFDADLLNELPNWVMKPERVHRLIDFCLFRAGRLDAAAAIQARAPETSGSKTSPRDAYLAFVPKCLQNNRPDRAVQCLRKAIDLSTPGASAIVDLRFRICDIWADARNFALAAGEAGQIARDVAGTERAGRAIYLRVKYFADKGDAKAVLHEVDDAIADPQCRPYLSELLYLKWQSLRKDGRGRAASGVLKRYLADFPKNAHAAEMYYAVAVDCLSAQRYDEALGILESLVKQYPRTPSAKRGQRLLGKLRNIAGEKSDQ